MKFLQPYSLFIAFICCALLGAFCVLFGQAAKAGKVSGLTFFSVLLFIGAVAVLVETTFGPSRDWFIPKAAHTRFVDPDWKKLSLQSGDVLVVRIPQSSRADIEKFKEWFQSRKEAHGLERVNVILTNQQVHIDKLPQGAVASLA